VSYASEEAGATRPKPMAKIFNGRRSTARTEARNSAPSGAPDWMVALVEKGVWVLLAIVAVIMAYLAIT
jgi:hypothetical protein